MKLRHYLQRVLRQYTLAVVAYGGWEDMFTSALGDLLHDDEAKPDILWCFRGADPRVVESEYKSLFEKVRPAITRGRFRPYGGIDCHGIFAELIPAAAAEPEVVTLSPPPVPATPVVASPPAAASPSPTVPRTPDPMPGWEMVDAALIANQGALTASEVVLYFDGAVPTWRHAVSAAIPRRELVKELFNQLETARTSATPSTLHLILGAGGEGKSTLLRQVAIDLARTGEWAVAWRYGSKATVDADQVANLDPNRCWLLATDDGDEIANDLFAAANRLHESGGRRVHFLIASRDTGWQAAGGNTLTWNAVLRKTETNLRGVSPEDARSIVGAWGAYGEQGLKSLATVSSEEQRVKQFEQAVANEPQIRGGGSFFGGLLIARLGEAGLRDHVGELLKRLQDIVIKGSERDATLFDALLYISACHGVGIPGIHREVLAQLLSVRNLQRDVLRRLGQEAAAVRGGEYIFTRHWRVAAAVLTEADDKFGADLAQVFSDVVYETVTVGRTMNFKETGSTFYRDVVNLGARLQRELPPEIPEEKRTEIAIAVAEAAKAAEPDYITRLIDLGNAYRNAGYHDEAAKVFRDNASGLEQKKDYFKTVRGFWFEWANCEWNARQDEHAAAASIWLAGKALADYPRPVQVTHGDVNKVCTRLGAPLKRLAQKGAANVFAKALRGVAFIGLIQPDETARRECRKQEADASALGAPPPRDVKEAIDWLQAGVNAAWALLKEHFQRNVTAHAGTSFQTLSNHFANTPPANPAKR